MALHKKVILLALRHKKVILLAHFVVSRNGIWRVERIPFSGRRFPSREPIFDNVGLSLASAQHTAKTRRICTDVLANKY